MTGTSLIYSLQVRRLRRILVVRELSLWVAVLDESNQQRIFQLIASLGSLLDKEMLVETVQSILGVEPVELDDCVHFDDLSVKFGRNGKVIGVYRMIDGST